MKVYIVYDEIYPFYFLTTSPEPQMGWEIPDELYNEWCRIEEAFSKMQDQMESLKKTGKLP